MALCSFPLHCSLQMSSSAATDDGVTLERVDSKGIITLSRPKALNALNLAMIRKIYPQLKVYSRIPSQFGQQTEKCQELKQFGDNSTETSRLQNSGWNSNKGLQAGTRSMDLSRGSNGFKERTRKLLKLHEGDFETDHQARHSRPV